MDPDGLRDKIAHYYAAYYREVRQQLEGRSYGVDTLPSHLMPWKKIVNVWETSDGHFYVEHFSNPRQSYSNLYEDYMQMVPPRDKTLRELTGVVTQPGAKTLAAFVRGKRLGDPGYEEVERGDYLERRDIITREKVPDLTEQEARKQAREDLAPYLS